MVCVYEWDVMIEYLYNMLRWGVKTGYGDVISRPYVNMLKPRNIYNKLRMLFEHQ